MRWLLLVGTIFLVLSSCEDAVYPGMNRIGEQLYQELHVLGDGERSPMVGDELAISMRLTLLDPDTTVNYATRFLTFAGPETKALSTVLENRVAGDSVSIIAPSSKIPWSIVGPESMAEPAPDRMLRVDIRLDAVLTQEEAKKERKAYESWMAERRREAEWSMDRYLMSKGIHPKDDLFGGVYVTKEVSGNGELIEFGDVVTLNYRGYFLDGSLFDDTYASGSSLTFKVGEQGQVIWGLSLAVRKLSEGARATVYIPYSFGFGATGSSTGIVPPFANLIYELDVVKVLRP